MSVDQMTTVPLVLNVASQCLILPAARCTETPVLRFTADWTSGRRCPARRYAKRFQWAVIRIVG